MAYIGRGTDKLSNIEKLDVITFDGSSSYTLQKNSVNFTPNSANSLQVSIDGVVQAGNFTVSGSTIDFGVAIPSTSTCDFIFHYGTGLITTPADGTVTTGKIQDGAVTSAKLASGVGGKVLQVASVTKTDTFSASISSDTSADITDLSLSITPSSTSSKILIMFNLQAATTTASRQSNFGMRLVRDTTFISLADTASNRPRTTSTFCLNHTTDGNATGIVAGSFLDSPSTTSATTYKIQLHNITSGTLTYYVNRTATDADVLNYRPRSTSTLTVMEISG